MPDIHAGAAMSRTRPWGVKESVPTSPLEPASHVPREQRPHGTSSSARASALIAAVGQRAFPTLKQPLSGDSRTRVRASLLSLLVLLSIAAAYWYMTAGQRVHTDDLYFDVGQADHSSDVAGVAGNRLRAVREIPYRRNAPQVQITYREREDQVPADKADLETAERDCWRMPSNIDPQPRESGSH